MAAQSIVSSIWITGATAVQIKWNVSLVTQKFSFHHMFKAFELSKFANQYWGLGRTHTIRRGQHSCKAKAVNTQINAACRLLWARQAISRWRKITRDCLAHCNTIKKVMKREPFLFDLRDYLTCCFRFACQKYVYAAWNLIMSIPCKYLDVIFFTVTFSPGENETRDKFTLS